jgi:hypothetical protein
MARRDPELSLWIRWLHVGCELPLEHVATVLGRECSFIATWFELNGRRLRFIPSGPPRRDRRPGPRHLISAETGTRIRVLSGLGYDAVKIAAVLAIDPDDTVEFLRRLEPIRCVTLRRPRLRRRESRPAVHPDDVGSSARPLTAIVPAAVVEARDLVELEPPAAPPASCPWVGSSSPTGGKRKLTDIQILEAGELLKSGATFPSVAKRFGVSVNTLRKYVDDVGTPHLLKDELGRWRARAAPFPSPPIGTDSETVHTE